MRNLISEVVSYLGSGLDFPAPSVAGTNTCEIVSGYVSPQEAVEGLPGAQASIHKPVGILYADIAEAASPKGDPETDSEARLEEAIRILMINIADNGGRLVSIDGHALLAEFDDLDRALHCAINVQLEARQWNASLPLSRQLLFRMGLASGCRSADRGDNDFASTSLAAYLDRLAFTGGICISESMREELAGHPSLKLVGAGKQYVKNLCGPVESFWIEVDTDRFVSRGSTGAVRVKASVS